MFIIKLIASLYVCALTRLVTNPLLTSISDDAMFDRYHGDISTALTELGSALHISIASEFSFMRKTSI